VSCMQYASNFSHSWSLAQYTACIPHELLTSSPLAASIVFSPQEDEKTSLQISK
jgi:hypothetical protein